jgi:hypothetical protein
LQIRSAAPNRRGCTLGRRTRGPGLALPALLTAALLFADGPMLAGQDTTPKPNPPLPDAPQAQNLTQPVAAKPDPCHVKKDTVAPDAKEAANAPTGASKPTGDAQSNGATQPTTQPATQSVPCPSRIPLINWYARFLDGPKVKPMTPKEKGWLAVRNVADPFNGLTILGSSAIAVGSNSHSPFGPGMPGFGRYVGVSYTENMTGEFIGTFLIPSIMHQDPHYHRMPTATMKRRIAHAFYQVLWTQGDNEKGMPNYANLAGFAIDDEIANLYVPGRDTDAASTAERYGTALATAPIDNFVSEFLPDVARHIHVQIVVIQRIINQVANKDATNNSP